jgi:hypothetical protein
MTKKEYLQMFKLWLIFFWKFVKSEVKRCFFLTDKVKYRSQIVRKRTSIASCSYNLKSDVELKITCKGYCKGEYHGCCAGFPRIWSVSQTTLTKFMLEHFICQQCKDLPSIISKFDELWTRKFDFLFHKVEEINHMTTKKIMQNDEAFVEISGHLHSVSKSLYDIEELHKNTSKKNFENTLLNELNTKSIGCQTDPPKTPSLLPVAPAASSSTSQCNSNKTEWRVIGEKKIWKADWSSYDNHMKSKKHKVKPTKDVISNKLKKKMEKMKKVTNRQNYNEFENFYQILDQFEHLEPPIYQQKPQKHLKPHQQRKKFQKQQRSHFTLETPGIQNFQHQPQPSTSHQHFSNNSPVQPKSLAKGHNEKYSNFVPGPILNPAISTTVSTQSQSPPQSMNFQRQSISVPVTVHQQPLMTNSATTFDYRQQSPSFIDPLMPPAVKNTLISAQENGRYALSRLHDSHLLKTVRYFLAYLHDNQDVCYEGFTAAHCKTLIGSKGLPTDFAALKSMYVDYNVLFGHINQNEVNNELLTLINFLTTNRINYLQRNRENSNKFYNSRNF